MGRVLIMTQPASLGHFAPFVGPVQWLRRMGHRVGWVCMNDHRAAQVKHLGIDVLRTKGDSPIALFGVDWMRPGEDAHTSKRTTTSGSARYRSVSTSPGRSAPSTPREVRARRR